MEQFLKKPLRLDIQDYEKIFILGLGGGCDIISAYAAQFLIDFSKGSKIIYGNTKRTIEDDLEKITPNIYRLPPKQKAIDEKSKDTIGTTKIDRSIPRGFDGCPYIVHFIDRSKKDLSHEINSLGFDLVIGIDTGGDAIVEGASSGSLGRDKEMVEIIKQAQVLLIIFIVGPGCDGESQDNQIFQSFRNQDLKGKYMGFCSIERLIPYFEELASNLSIDRTPNILKRAFYGELAQDEKGRIDIPRGINPSIAKLWLLHCFAFGLY